MEGGVDVRPQPSEETGERSERRSFLERERNQTGPKRERERLMASDSAQPKRERNTCLAEAREGISGPAKE